MTSEEGVQAFKEIERKALKRARAQSIILGLSAVVAVLGMIYGFINSIEARTQRDAAIANEQKATEFKLDADKQREIANGLEKELTSLKDELAACKARK